MWHPFVRARPDPGFQHKNLFVPWLKAMNLVPQKRGVTEVQQLQGCSGGQEPRRCRVGQGRALCCLSFPISKNTKKETSFLAKSACGKCHRRAVDCCCVGDAETRVVNQESREIGRSPRCSGTGWLLAPWGWPTGYAPRSPPLRPLRARSLKAGKV